MFAYKERVDLIGDSLYSTYTQGGRLVVRVCLP